MPNHLEHESSPYLQQHANNPVHWYPWGKEALEKAKQENKPILLSIGYAACHWCHVMAHESFEDQETADLMNTLFINIKVDREERPDLDKIYQTTHYLLTRSGGGWPLTVFLTPGDLTPFFSGTYFPRESRYHLPAFKDILKSIADLYQERLPEIQQQNTELLSLLQKERPSTPSPINKNPIQQALVELEQNYDSVNGGFGQAPKFPQTPKLEFLLANQSSLVSPTLNHMAKGGIYDQLEGGFYRYTVDANWRIPHFEKMLYDNALLLGLYARLNLLQKDPLLADITHATANWAIKKMQAESAGYFSSLDADSEGKEGQYYLWNPSDVKKLLTPEEYAVTALYFGLDKPPNFENEWCFYVDKTVEEVASSLKLSMKQVNEHIQSAKSKLLTAREKRIPPHTDKKILTAWNSLMLKAMVIGGHVLNEPRFIDSAYRTLTFIQHHLWKNNRLLANYANGKAHLPAYLDDYVFLIDALCTILQIEWNTEYFLFAVELTERILTDFFDAKDGGFFFTAKDQEKVLYRPKTMMDEAIPAGNGVAVQTLTLLGYLLGETRYLNAAEKTLQAAWPYLSTFPSEHCTLLMGLKDFLEPKEMIIIRGQSAEIKQWQKESQSSRNIVFAIPDNAKLPPALESKKLIGKTCAYICKGTHCSAVIENLKELIERLER